MASNKVRPGQKNSKIKKSKFDDPNYVHFSGENIREEDIFNEFVDRLFKGYCEFSDKEIASNPKYYMGMIDIGIKYLREIFSEEEKLSGEIPLPSYKYRDNYLTKALILRRELQEIFDDDPISSISEKISWYGTQGQLVLLVEALKELGLIREENFLLLIENHFCNGKKDGKPLDHHLLSSVSREINEEKRMQIEILKNRLLKQHSEK